jgi:hypothetical protein
MPGSSAPREGTFARTVFVLEVIGEIEKASARRDACQTCHVNIFYNYLSRKRGSSKSNYAYQLGKILGKEKIATKQEAL